MLKQFLSIDIVKIIEWAAAKPARQHLIRALGLLLILESLRPTLNSLLHNQVEPKEFQKRKYRSTSILKN